MYMARLLLILVLMTHGAASLAAPPALLKPAAPAASQAAKAPPVASAPAQQANARRATAGPGTQTEDDLYVGVKKGTKVKRKTADCGKECDDLEVERVRRK